MEFLGKCVGRCLARGADDIVGLETELERAPRQCIAVVAPLHALSVGDNYTDYIAEVEHAVWLAANKGHSLR